MQVKMRLAAIASAMALAASLGVAFAGPAAAADNIKLCVPDTTNGLEVCAESFPTAGTIVDLVGSIDDSSLYNVPGVKGQISQGNSGLCMEINASDGDSIRLEPCQGKASEEWTTAKGQEKGTTVFKSVYNTSLCLNADPYGTHPQVLADKCSSNDSNLNQEWNTLTG